MAKFFLKSDIDCHDSDFYFLKGGGIFKKKNCIILGKRIFPRDRQFYKNEMLRGDKNIEIVGDRTLVFVKFKKWFDVLGRMFDFGIFNADQKDDLELFDIGVLTYGCGAFGLNLQKFSRVIFLDQTFDYGQKIQALSRVRRLGQKQDIEVFDLYVDTGLEKIIERSLDKKTGTSQNVVSILKNMSEEELRCL